MIVALPGAVLALALASAGGPEAGRPAARKLIERGWDEPDTVFIRENWSRTEASADFRNFQLHSIDNW